ncbi:MAG: hypothetical protein IJX47_07765 [Clostridia bacterium]|nr:hypothetical protein [Clostridia bacterium]
MKKTLSLILAGLMLTAVLAACGGETTVTTSADTTTDTPVTTTKASVTTTMTPVTTTGAVGGVTTTEDPTGGNVPETDGNTPETTDDGSNTPTPEVTTNAGGSEETPEVTTGNEGVENPDVPEQTALVWYDNNGDQGTYYEITVNADGATEVSYTKETYDDALAQYGYAGYSWVNMAADISEVYTDQATFVIRVQGEAGKTLLIKPFDNQSFEQTVNLDGSVQTFTFTLNNVPADAARSIIIFGDGGAVDTSGEFTILDAYFE